MRYSSTQRCWAVSLFLSTILFSIQSFYGGGNMIQMNIRLNRKRLKACEHKGYESYKKLGLVKYRVETVCHTAFSIAKNKVENIQPNIPVHASTSPVIITSAKRFTAVFPVCPHAFCLLAGSEHPVRTLYTAYAVFSFNICNPSLRIFTAAL